MVEPAKPLGTANEAATSPLVVAFAVASTVAPKLMATGSDGANLRQVSVTRDPAGPVFGETVHLALAEVTTVAVVVPGDPAVGRVVEAAVGCVVGTEDGEDPSAVRWVVRDAQPVTARAATKTTVATIRTGRMATPPNKHDPVSPGQQPRLSRSQHGRGWVSRQPRTGLDPVAILHPNKHAAHCL
jgi:hypothetical protein